MSTGFFVAFLIDIFSYCFATQKNMNKKNKNKKLAGRLKRSEMV